MTKRNRSRRPTLYYWQPVFAGSARLTRSGLPGHPSVRPSSHSFPPSSLIVVRSFVRLFPPSRLKPYLPFFDYSGRRIIGYQSLHPFKGKGRSIFPFIIDSVDWIRGESKLLKSHTSHGRFHLMVFRRPFASASSMSLTTPSDMKKLLGEAIAVKFHDLNLFKNRREKLL